MLQPHDLVPHFEVSDLKGRHVQYLSIWQRKNLVLVMLPEADPSSQGYAERLMAQVPGLNEADTACIITPDMVTGLPHPGVVVADRWGEIVHVASSESAHDLPAPDDIHEWVEYVRHRCPECEGEAR